MIRRFEIDPADRDERLGEAIEHFLALAEEGHAPDLEAFAARHPELGDDLRSALEGLALVRGLVGDAHGPDGHRLEAGRRVAGYRIVRELGRGGMGVVYEAVHVGLDRPVALKVLGTHTAPDSNGRRRFLNEARTAAGLHHTHIVPVFDVGQVGGLCYYAMQRIEGSGLDRVVRALRLDRVTAAGSGSGKKPEARPEPGGDETGTWVGGPGDTGAVARGPAPSDDTTPFAPPRGSAYYRWVATVGRDAAEALAHAHRGGIIHRDVKPSNLLVDTRGTVWVADFGLARRLADPALTRSDSLLGTPRYMSPEQAESGAIDGRTDVYSLGATLYELLTLRPPFEGQTAVELVRQIVGREPTPPRRFDIRLPRDLETIVLKAQAKRPADRYATATELAEDLGRFLATEPVRARRIGPAGRLWRLARRNPAASAVTATAAALVLAVATVAHLGLMRARDFAIDAERQTRKALGATEDANRAMTDALRRQRLSEASYVRLSAVPRRRKTGLDLLGEAAKLHPDSALLARLRDEAAEFLALRDVEPSLPIEAGPAQAVVFGSLGNRAALLSADGVELTFWDVPRRERLARHRLGNPPPTPVGPPPYGPPGGAYGPPSGGGYGDPRRGGSGGGRLASCGHLVAAIRPDGAGVRLFDLDTGAEQGDLAMPGREVLSLAGAGTRLVSVERLSGGRTHQIRVWDPEHAEGPVATLPESEDLDPPGRGRTLVALSPDGETLATARVLQTDIGLWSARDGRPRGTIEAGMSPTALALGPEGLLAAAGAGAVRLWEADTLNPLPSISPHLAIVQLMRFSPDGTTLALAGRDAGIELWDTANAAPVAFLPMSDHVADLAFSRPQGRTLAAAVDGSQAVPTWSVVDPIGLVRLPESDGPTTSMAFSQAGVLAVAAFDSPLRLWEPGSCPTTSPTWRNALPTSLVFDQRGHLLALDVRGLSGYPAPSAQDLKGNGEGPGPLVRVALPHSQGAGGTGKGPPPLRGPTAIARSADGRCVALVRRAEVWLAHIDGSQASYALLKPPPTVDPPSQGRVRERRGPGGWRAVAMSPAADRLYLIGGGDEFHAWALVDGSPDARALDWSVPKAVTALSLSPDGRTLALGEPHGAVTLIDAAGGTARGRLVPPSGDVPERVTSLAFAPGVAELAVGTREKVRLWRLGDDPAPLVRLPGHRGRVSVLAYDAAGRHLATGGEDKVVAVWDLDRVRQEFQKRGLGW